MIHVPQSVSQYRLLYELQLDQNTGTGTSQGHLLQLDFLHDDDKFVTWVKGTCNVMRDHRDGIK